jgi:hypothetical protein
VQPRHGRPRAVLDDDLAPIAEDLEPVGTGDVVRAGDERARGAVAVVDQRGDLVLHRDVPADPISELGIDGLRDAADPLPEVELVRRLVDEDAAPLAAPGGAPRTGVVVPLRPPPGGDDPVGAPDRADLAGLDDLLEPTVERVHALVEHDAEGELRLRGGERDEIVRLLRVHAGRLVDERVDSAAERRDAHLRVQVVRHGRDDRVDVAARDHLEVVLMDRDVGVGRPRQVLLGRVDVADGPDRQVRDHALRDHLGIHPPLLAQSDDAEPHSVRHGSLRFSSRRPRPRPRRGIATAPSNSSHLRPLRQVRRRDGYQLPGVAASRGAPVEPEGDGVVEDGPTG